MTKLKITANDSEQWSASDWEAISKIAGATVTHELIVAAMEEKATR